MQRISLRPDGTEAGPRDATAPAETRSKRPALAVGNGSYAVAWNLNPQAALARVTHGSSREVGRIEGHDPWIVRSSTAPDQYRVSWISEGTVSIGTLDIDASLRGVESLPGSSGGRSRPVMAARILEAPRHEVTATLSERDDLVAPLQVRIVTGGSSQVEEPPEMYERWEDFAAAIDPDYDLTLAVRPTLLHCTWRPSTATFRPSWPIATNRFRSISAG